MKIAFVGKGGSGKSTITSLFIKHALAKGEKVLAIDADINIHLAKQLGLKAEDGLSLSKNENAHEIREYLRGNNERIHSINHFVKTTPPGTGSQFITLDKANLILAKFAQPFGEGSYFMYVGTYEGDTIGTACYHTNLSVFENILSHAVLGKQELVVADMVAGTDAFSNTLHAQFDGIVLIIEPTVEGTGVFKQYIELAKEAGVSDSIFVIGNKVEDEVDVAYLREQVGDKLLGYIGLKKEIKHARQKGLGVDLSLLSNNERDLLNTLMDLIVKAAPTNESRMKKLYELHKRYVAQSYVVNECGHISDQIDEHFVMPKR